MNLSPRIEVCHREELPDALTGGRGPHRLAKKSLASLMNLAIPPRGALVGVWGERFGDPFPDFMVVNDSDLADTHAWLSSFLNALAPITQWCRVWALSDFRDSIDAREKPDLGPSLTPWVGAILAECTVQGNGPVNLKDLSGTAALTSACFSAARAASVWGPAAQLPEIARRHDDLSVRLRDGSRRIAATQMLPMWYVLSHEQWRGRPPAEERALRPIRLALEYAISSGAERSPAIGEATRLLMEEYDLPELLRCGSGPQTQRVEALDKLGTRLQDGPKSGAVDAILGFGASLIDPGAAVLPDLLRRYSSTFPMAQLWAGAFAGAWSPFRVLTEFQGLGRIITKELMRDSDVFAKPHGDIGYDELTRWIGSSAGGKVPVRGMVARTLNVEILPGVTAPFPVGRPEQPTSRDPSPARQSPLPLGEADLPRNTGRSLKPNAALSELIESLNQIIHRVSAIEDEVRQNGSPRRISQRGTKVGAKKK